MWGTQLPAYSGKLSYSARLENAKCFHFTIWTRSTTMASVCVPMGWRREQRCYAARTQKSTRSGRGLKMQHNDAVSAAQTYHLDSRSPKRLLSSTCKHFQMGVMFPCGCCFFSLTLMGAFCSPQTRADHSRDCFRKSSDESFWWGRSGCFCDFWLAVSQQQWEAHVDIIIIIRTSELSQILASSCSSVICF